VPYHFKGLRKDQVDDILAQREQQTVDNKIQRQNENSEEYQWKCTGSNCEPFRASTSFTGLGPPTATRHHP
jgi:hypothetical protein